MHITIKMRAWFLFIAAALLSLGAMWQFSIATTEVQIIGAYGTWTVAAVLLCGAMVVNSLGDVAAELAQRSPASGGES